MLALSWVPSSLPSAWSTGFRMARSKGTVGCKDCKREGRQKWRPTPYPGPRCATHFGEWKKLKKTERRESSVYDRYNLPPEVYRALLAQQNGLCAICQRWRANSVDHDHKCCDGPFSCGKCVRGLLCRTCNTILGRWRDDAETFLRAAQYLKEPPATGLVVASPDDTVVHPTLPTVDQ